MRNTTRFWHYVVALAAVALCAAPASATTYNLTFGAPYAAGSGITPSTAEQYTGAGSWFEQYPSTKTEIYVDPVAQFGTSFTIDDILSVKYHTLNDGTNPSGVDFYMLIYTPLEGSDNDGSFYNKRLNSEPYLTNGYVPPTGGVWNEWDTDAGANQLTFYDANNCGNFGFYGAPTLADLQAGSINWSTWPGNPTQGTSDPVAKDYGSKSVRFLNWSSASGWASFAGYIDAIEVNLTNGDTYLINLEAKTDPVYVDDDWAGSAPGVEVEPGKFYGWNAFDKVQDGVNNVSGSTVFIAPGTYEEQVEVTMDMEIIGSGAGSTIIKAPTALTKFFVTAGPNNNYPVIYVHDAADVDISELTVDGAGRGNANYRFIGVGYRNAGGTLENCDIIDIRNTPIDGSQHGVGIYAFADNGTARTLDVLGNSVSGFQKNGSTFVGANLTANIDGNTVTGAGAVNFIAQNGIQVSSGAAGSVTNNTVTGFAYTPFTFSSAGVLIFGAASPLTTSGNTVDEAMVGIWYINTDGTISENNLTNTAGGMGATPYWWQIVADPGVGTSRQPKAQPIDEEAAIATAAPSANRMAASAMLLSTSVYRNTVDGGGNGTGIEGDALGTETLILSVEENAVSNCLASFVLYDDPAATLDADLYNNSSVGSTIGVENQTGVLQDASGNWWGSNDPGTVASLMSGGDIDYSPWLHDGTDTDLGTDGFQGDFSALWADDDSPVSGAEHHIQEAVGMVSGSTVYLAPGTFVGQTVISAFADLNLIGSGIGVSILNPPAAPMAYNFTTPASNFAVIAIVNSDDVDVSELTVDGLGLGNINNRFIGIGYFESGGSVDNCEVKDIRHTPINGVQGGNGIYGFNFALPARTVEVSNTHVVGFQKGGIVMNGDFLTANVVGNDVDGFGPASFIAMNGVQLGFGATGSVTDNEIYGCSYTPGSFVSAGVLLFNAAPIAGSIDLRRNLIEDCQVGAYFINVGGNADSNTVTASAVGVGTTPYWNMVIDPTSRDLRIKPQPSEETVVNASSASNMAASAAALSTSVGWNTLDGAGDGYGLEMDAYAPEVLTVDAHHNSVTAFDAGVVMWEESGATLNATLTHNYIAYNDLGVSNTDGSVDAQFNTICSNVISADDNTAGNFYDQNSWSDWNGITPYIVGGAGANVDNNPTGGCGLSMTPGVIAYDCDGDFSFDIAMGDNVTGMALTDIILAYPPSLGVVSVTTALPGWGVSTSGGAGTLNITLSHASSTIDGPATLLTVTMSGSESCLNSEIDMTYAKLYEQTDRTGEIPSSLAPSIQLLTDCVDPTFAVNGPAAGACYNTPPAIDFTAADDCDLDAIFYQVDGCGGAWLPITSGLSGTVYNDPAWVLPGFAGLADGPHTVYFRATDDVGRFVECAGAWTFTKDVTPPTIACPADETYDCEGEIPAADINLVTAADNLGTVTVTWEGDGPLSGSACLGTVARTYRATDGCGNFTECTQTFTVDDNTPPTITCLGPITVQRFLDLPPCDAGDVTVSDNCGGLVTVDCERTNVGGVGCTDDPIPVTYTWTATDACGNVAQCSRVVTVVRPDCPFVVAAGNSEGPNEVYAGQQFTLPLRVDTMGNEIGTFDLAFAYDKNAVTILGVDRGTAVAGWEYFSYRVETGEDGSGIVRLIGIADLNNGASHPSYTAYRPIGELALVRMAISADPSYSNQSLDLIPCLNGCTDNTVTSRSGDMTFVMAESNFEACELAGTVLPGVRFDGLRLDIKQPQSITGDMNLNRVAYEVGDVVMLANYLVNGESALSADAALRQVQMTASDVNDDGVLASVADLRYLLRVVAGDATPVSGAKLSPYAHNGQAQYRVENGQLIVSSESNVDLGGAFFIFRTNGLSLGTAALSNDASGMTVRSNSMADQFRVLVSPEAGQIASVGSGRHELFTIPVTGDGSIELVEVQMSDAQGSLLLTSAFKTVLPTDYALAQNYPNPFNAGTVIPFALKDASEWNLTIYNVMGQVVRNFTGANEAGQINVNWDGSDENGSSVSSGVYFYRVQAGTWNATKKMTLIK